jgi:succinate dehydrogenase/fumarate reductase cytochrome b subunit
MTAQSVTVTRLLLRTARVSGWVLLFLVVLFLVTGYALSGKYGLDQVVGPQTALTIHRIFDWPLILFFMAHAATSVYFAMRRWGWIRSAKPSRGLAREAMTIPHAPTGNEQQERVDRGIGLDEVTGTRNPRGA